MLRSLSFPVFALLMAVTPNLAYAEDARIVHSKRYFSTLASDVTNYYSGDVDAFNVILAKTASEYPAPPAIVTRGGRIEPNIKVFIYKGTGEAYLTKSLNRKTKDEVNSEPMPAFNFDWIVTTSATKTERQASIVLFAGGNVDIFELRVPQNVELKIGRPAIATVRRDVSAKPKSGEQQ
jgi:hypothetical protein